MSKWIAEFDLEDGDTMPEHMDLNYMGAKIDFHCRPMWIPVSERLPKEDDFYLVTAKVGNEFIIDISEYTPKNDSWDIPHEIVAWMPLPEPYKAESED